MYVAIVNPTVSGAAPRPDGYDWLRLLAYVRAQSQIGWVRVSDSEPSRPYRISVNARVSRFPGWVRFPWQLVEGRRMLLWFRGSSCATCRGNKYGSHREHGWQQGGNRPAIRHGTPSRTQERMR